MKTKQTNKKILVAMSGGVDSSVAAAELVEAGYDVSGAFMINYDDSDGAACWLNDYHDALKVAAKLKIRLLKFDFTREYRAAVLGYMLSQYEKGLTPNPDVLCNNKIKFGVWLRKIKKLGFDYLATGHYAKVENSKTNLYRLMIPKDTIKDQTYFLHGLNQNQLSQVIFPLNNMTKTEARKKAVKLGLANANKKESMGICFIGEVKMADFLRDKIKTKPGKIIFGDFGEEVGFHQGLAYYTIGQRHLGKIDTSKIFEGKKKTRPLYVVDKDFQTANLCVGFGNDPKLYAKNCVLKNIHWISGQTPNFPLQCKVRLRHRQKPCDCTVKSQKRNKLAVEFEKAQRAVTPGQFAVFYIKKECLGGGEIE